jgi:hypothetical protein
MAIGIGKNSGTVRLQLNHAQANSCFSVIFDGFTKANGWPASPAELFYHNYPTYQTPQTANRYVEKLAYNPNYNQTPLNTTTKNTTQKTTTRHCCARKNRTTTTKERKYSLKKQEF